MTFTRANLIRLTRGGGGGPVPPDEVQFLQLGGGWEGETPTPDPVGEDGAEGTLQHYVYNSIPTVGWDMMPNQDISGIVYFALAADHMETSEEFAAGMDNNIIGVRYSVDNGPWVEEFRARTNPQSGTPDVYYVGIDARDHPTKRVSVRAQTIVTTGQGFVMQGDDPSADYHSLFINLDAARSMFYREYVVDNVNGSDSNAGTEAAPLLTIARARELGFTASGNAGVGGVKALLTAGAGWRLGDNATENFQRSAGDRWFEIEAIEPGSVTFDTILSTSGSFTGLNISRIKISGCKFTGTQRLQGKDTTQWLWLNDFEYVGAGQQTTGSMGGALVLGGSFGPVFASYGTYTDSRGGIRSARKQLNVHYERIGEDVFTASRGMFNCSSDVQDRGAGNIGAWHPDFFAFNTPIDGQPDNTQRNTLIWNCRGVDLNAQLISADVRLPGVADILNASIVNCELGMRPGAGFKAWQIARKQTNFHVRNLTLTGGGSMDFNFETAEYLGLLFTNTVTDGAVNGITAKPGVFVHGGNLS